MLDLMKFFKSGPRSQTTVINGVARRVTYGGSHMMALTETNGPQVLRLPSTWLRISPRWQRLLYLGRSNVEDSWPFMETRLGTMASVAPFEVTDNDNMQPIVMIIPVEFVTPGVDQVGLEVVRKVREEKQEAAFQFFPRSIHCRFISISPLISIGRQAYLEFVEKIHASLVL